MSIGLLGGGNKNSVAICAPPISIGLVRSASIFTEVVVNNYGLLVPADGTYDGTNIFYRPTRDAGNAITNLEYLRGRAGICPLPASGSWWVNAQTNIAAGTSRMVLYDMPSLESMLALMTVLTNTDPSVRTMSAATFTDVSVDTQIVAGNSARSLLILTHTGYSDAGVTPTTADLFLNWGASAAVKGTGIVLPAKTSLVFDRTQGLTLQAARGIATSGTIRVGVQEAI